MKKSLSFIIFFILAIVLVPFANAETIEGIYDNYQIIYSPSSNSFAPGGMAEDRMVLAKKTSSGSGSYSSYFLQDKEVITLGSNFEFIKDGKLIACHNSNLTFYNVVYADGKFSEKQMTEKEVQELFPDAKIIKISQFSKGKFKVSKPAGKDLEIILLNDTDKDFYKYSYNPSEVKKTDIAGLIEISKPGKIEFSHFGENTKNSPKYIIEVKAE